MPTMPMTVVNEIGSLVGNSRNAYAAMMKHQYAPEWDSWVHTDSSTLSNLISKKKGTMYGQMKVTAVSTGLPQSAGMSTFEGYQLTTPTSGTYLNPRMFARSLITRLRWTRQLRTAARKGNLAAWSRPMTQDLEDARLQSGLNWGRKLWTGYHDVNAVASAYSAVLPTAATTDGRFTLFGRNTRTSGDTTAEDWYRFGVHYLRVGMMIGAVNAATGPGGSLTGVNHSLTGNEVRITAVNDATAASPFIDVASQDGATAVTTLLGFTPGSGDMVIPYANRVAAPGTGAASDTDFSCMNGIASFILGSGYYASLYGLLKTATTRLSGIVDANGEVQRAWTERLLTFMTHRIRNEGTGGRPKWAVEHDSVLREIVDENRGDRRFHPVQRESGYDYHLQHTAGDVMISYIADWLAPPGMVLALDDSVFGYYSEADMMPEPEVRFVPNFLQEEQIWFKSGNLECTKPHNNGIVDDLTFSTTALT